MPVLFKRAILWGAHCGTMMLRRSGLAGLWGRYRARRYGPGLFAQFYRQFGPNLPVVQIPHLLSVVVPVYNAPPAHLRALWSSIMAQPCPAVEVIFVDDASTNPRTKAWLQRLADRGECVVWQNQNGGIAAALNAGVAVAQGDWITFLDHDDMVAPYGLRAVTAALASSPDAEFVYTDEVLVNHRGRIIGWFCKPAFDPALLGGMNYINHFSVFRRDKLAAVGPLDSDFDGSQDYEILLRYLATCDPAHVLHLPYPAYQWRRVKQTYSRKHLDQSLANARRALAAHHGQGAYKVAVGPALGHELHRVTFTPQDDWPSVGVVIPNRDAPDLLKTLLQGLFEKTDYPNFQVVVVDDDSQDLATAQLYDDFAARYGNFQVLYKDGAFNFSRSVNLGMSALRTDHILLANNDIGVQDPGWLKEMVGCMSHPGTGIVGAKLLFADGSLQHAGLMLGQGGVAGHWFYGHPDTSPGPMGRLWVRGGVTAVTGALMLISRACADAVGPWDEVNFAVSFNDVDYCLRAHDLGFRTVWTPFASLTHIGSASRGPWEDPARAARERDALQKRHNTHRRLDPAASPFFARTSDAAALCLPDHCPPVRTWHG